MTMQIALVGCGGMGLRHAYGYIEMRKYFDSFHLAAVCDLHESTANHLASEVENATGARPKVYTDLARMLDEEQSLDAVDIVTDTRMHHTFAQMAFDAGLHVMTEKPLGLTVRACQLMRSAAENSGRTLSVAENYRRDPMNRLTRALLDAGVIGTPQFMIKIGVSGGSALMHNTGWRALKSRAGSIILEQGVHDADLMLYFLGDVHSVYAATGLFTRVRRRDPINPRLAQFYSHRVEEEFAGDSTVELDQEDTAFAVLRFSSGAVGQYGITNASHGHSVGVDTVHGSLGTIEMPPSRSGQTPTVHIEGQAMPLTGEQLLAAVPDWELDDIASRFWEGERRIASYQMPFEAIDRKLIGIEYEEFADAIRTGRQPEVDADMGMKALALAYATLESGMVHQPVFMTDMLEGTVDAYQREVNESAGL